VNFTRLYISVFIGFIFLSVNIQADTKIQPGIVIKDTSVFEKPSRRSDILYSLEEDTKVYIKERHKSWYNIEAQKTPPRLASIINCSVYW